MKREAGSELKVGFLFLFTLVLITVFAYLLGGLTFLSRGEQLQIAYNFAGGIDIGSPVRVMGIKVGRVTAIEFAPGTQLPNGEITNLKVKVDIDKRAWPTVRADSRYYINLAGVIGEKFLEITPGTPNSAQIQPGSLVRGEDPPRIDQLLSQSYNLAGKLVDVVEKNEGSVQNTLETFDRLVTNLNRGLVQLDKTTKDEDLRKLVKNMVKISDDVAFFTGRLRSPGAEKTFQIMQELVKRMEKVDAKVIKKFLQEEGIKANIF